MLRLPSRWRCRWSRAARPALALMALAWVAAALLPRGDMLLYARYAREALTAPYLHRLPVEYPAASLGIFLLPRLLPLPYVMAFGLLAELGLLALLLSSDGLPARPGWSRRVAVYFLLGAFCVLVARYDVFPALCALLAVERARSGRWGRAWAWGVLGALLKVFPALLLPGFLLAERRSSGRWPLRRILASATAVAAVLGAQLAIAPRSVMSPLSYELHRGFELSSLGGSLTLLADPGHVRWISGYGSIEVAGPHAVLIGAAVALLGLASLAAIWRLSAAGRLGVEATSLAVLSVAVLSDRAFAAQYLVWLVPLWAYWEIRRGWLAAAGLTTLVFPFLYVEAATLGPGYYVATATAAVRNGILVVSTLLWLREQLADDRAGLQVPAKDLPALPALT